MKRGDQLPLEVRGPVQAYEKKLFITGKYLHSLPNYGNDSLPTIDFDHKARDIAKELYEVYFPVGASDAELPSNPEPENKGKKVKVAYTRYVIPLGETGLTGKESATVTFDDGGSFIVPAGHAAFAMIRYFASTHRGYLGFSIKKAKSIAI